MPYASKGPGDLDLPPAAPNWHITVGLAAPQDERCAMGSQPPDARERGARPLDPGRYSSSLEHGLALLRCFTPEQPVLGVAELVDLLEASRSTIHRYAVTLVALGWLEQTESRKYRLGREAYSLGIAAIRRLGIGDIARPWLAELRSKTGFSAGLAVLDGDEVIYAAWLPSMREGQAEPATARRAGWCAPVQTSAAGMALLSFMAEADWPERIRARAARTSLARRRLLAELEEACERGYATCDGRPKDRRRGVAAAVLGATDVIAAVELTVFGEAAGEVDLHGFAGAVCRAADGLREQIEQESVEEKSWPA